MHKCSRNSHKKPRSLIKVNIGMLLKNYRCLVIPREKKINWITTRSGNDLLSHPANLLQRTYLKDTLATLWTDEYPGSSKEVEDWREQFTHIYQPMNGTQEGTVSNTSMWLQTCLPSAHSRKRATERHYPQVTPDGYSQPSLRSKLRVHWGTLSCTE